MKLLMVLGLAAACAGCGTMPAQTGMMPAIAQLLPATMAADSSPFMLEVEGSNFGSGATVNFNGHSVTTTFVSATRLTAAIPTSAVMSPGTVPVTVTNPGMAGGMSSAGTMSATSAPMNFKID